MRSAAGAVSVSGRSPLRRRISHHAAVAASTVIGAATVAAAAGPAASARAAGLHPFHRAPPCLLSAMAAVEAGAGAVAGVTIITAATQTGRCGLAARAPRRRRQTSPAGLGIRTRAMGAQSEAATAAGARRLRLRVTGVHQRSAGARRRGWPVASMMGRDEFVGKCNPSVRACRRSGARPRGVEAAAAVAAAAVAAALVVLAISRRCRARPGPAGSDVRGRATTVCRAAAIADSRAMR